MNLQDTGRVRSWITLGRKWVNGLGLIAIIVIMLGHLLFLTRVPTVFVDEGWYANSTWYWLKTGVNRDPIFGDVFDQFGSPWVRGYFIGQFPWYLTFATLGLGFFQARLTSWILAAGLLVAVVFLGRQLYSTRAGILAALLLALSTPFLYASHYARQDVWLALVAVVGYYLIMLGMKHNRWWGHVAGCFLFGVSPDIHQNGIVYIPAVIVLYILNYGKGFLRSRGTWLAALGGVAGFLVFAALHLLPDPAISFRLIEFAAANTLPILSPVSLARSAVGELNRYEFIQNNFDLALIAAGAVYLLFRRRQADRYLLAFIGVYQMASIAFIGNKSFLYGILLYPFLVLITAECLLSLFKEARHLNKVRLFLGMILVVFVFKGVYALGRRISNNRDYDYERVVEQIHRLVPPDARIMGMAQWWFGLADHEYLSSFVIPFYRFYNNYTVSQTLETTRPDIIIVDSLTGSLLAEADDVMPAMLNVFRIPRGEFLEFLDERGTQLDPFSDPILGEFYIYAIDWGD